MIWGLNLFVQIQLIFYSFVVCFSLEYEPA